MARKTIKTGEWPEGPTRPQVIIVTGQRKKAKFFGQASVKPVTESVAARNRNSLAASSRSGHLEAHGRMRNSECRRSTRKFVPSHVVLRFGVTMKCRLAVART